MAEVVPTNNQRGRRSGPCRLWRGLDKARHIVPTALLVRVQCFRKRVCKAVQGPSTRPIVLSMITGSYCRRRRRLTIFEPDETKFGVSLANNQPKPLQKNASKKFDYTTNLSNNYLHVAILTGTFFMFSNTPNCQFRSTNGTYLHVKRVPKIDFISIFVPRSIWQCNTWMVVWGNVNLFFNFYNW